MKKADIIKRIIEIVDYKSNHGKLDLFTYLGGIDRSILISEDGQYYYAYVYSVWNLKNLYKNQLASLLFEIGDEQDRSRVKESMDLDTYLWLYEKLGLIKSGDK